MKKIILALTLVCFALTGRSQELASPNGLLKL